MKFTKLAKSEKFEYMMLSRLIQDAKYFIEHPDLKHLWARTLDEHIKQMKEQYAKLDPKPEWTSEEEINNLAKQMKESYTNHWNEVHPDNKIEAAIQQPNKPKPTTMLPDNMQWAWDPDAADWVAVLKDNTNITPPLYDPSNQNVVNQTTNYMSTVKSSSNLIDVTIKFDNGDIIETNVNGNRTDEQIKEYYKLGKTFNLGSGENDNLAKVVDVIIDRSMQKQSSCLAKFLDGPQFSKEIKIEAGLIKEGLVKYAGFDFNRGTKYAITDKGLEVLRKASEAEHNEALNEREKLAYLFGFNTDEVSTLDTTGKVITSEENILSLIDVIGRNENEFKYIEDIVDAINHTEFDANEPEPWWTVRRYDVNGGDTIELVDFRDKQYATIKLSKQFPSKYYSKDKKGGIKASRYNTFTITEADGCELGKVTASSELDAKVKFGIEHPEYADSQSICAKEIKSSTKFINELTEEGLDAYNFVTKLLGHKLDLGYHPWYGICDLVDIDDINIANKINDKFGASGNFIESYSGKWGDGSSYWIGFENKQDTKKEVDAQYEQTTNTKEPYPNPSETPHDDIVLENHDGWVNTASFEDDIRKQFQKPHQKLPNSDRDLELLEKQVLDLIDEDKKDQIKALFDRVQFSGKEAAKYNYTPEQKRLLPLFKLVNQYVVRKEVIISEDVQNDDGFVVSGTAEIINDLEHKIKDLGFYCEPVAEIVDNSYIGKDIYSLRVFEK